MDARKYGEGLALSILPEGHSYHFQTVNVISEIDENGEMQLDIVGRADVGSVANTKTFLEEFYDSCGSTFNVRSGRADRQGKDTEIRGYRKCIMQVIQKQTRNPKTKGLHQNCKAELNFKLENARSILPRDSLRLKEQKTLMANFPLFFQYQV